MLNNLPNLVRKWLAQHVCAHTGRPLEILAILDDDQGRRCLVRHDDGRVDYLLEADIAPALRLFATNVGFLGALALSGLVAGLAIAGAIAG